jgi:hypothetical protein
LGLFNDRNPGWGEKETSLPTLFHSAYVCFTLNSVDNTSHSNYKVIKCVSAIEKFLSINERTSFITYRKHEIYQFGTRRLNYTHSVDIYSTLAVLSYYYTSKQKIPGAIEEKCNAFLCSAYSTDWSYDGFVTCWRLL